MEQYKALPFINNGKIKRYNVIKKPHWVNDPNNTTNIPYDLTIGSITWSDYEIGDLSQHIENNRYGVNFDPSCFEEIKEFQKGDYIVLLDTPEDDYYYPKNYIFRQRKDHSYLLSSQDCSGNKVNGCVIINYQDTSSWRYATQAEIDEYVRLGKPFNINNLVETKQMTSLEQWLKDTKAKNLSLEELNSFIINELTCSNEVWKNLEGNGTTNKAAILYNLWNAEDNIEDFELPKYWCIKFTPENKELLSEWIKSHKDFNYCYDNQFEGWCTSDRGDGSYMDLGSSLPSRYTCITFEQFKEYVLKTETTESLSTQEHSKISKPKEIKNSLKIEKIKETILNQKNNNKFKIQIES